METPKFVTVTVVLYTKVTVTTYTIFPIEFTSQLLSVMSRDSITSEVVEDSEPEREESRRQKQRNSAKRPSQIQSSSEFPAKINSQSQFFVIIYRRL